MQGVLGFLLPPQRLIFDAGGPRISPPPVEANI